MKNRQIGIERLYVGPLQVNCCLLWDKTVRQGIIIDPGDDAPQIIRMIEKTGANVRYILDTHGHFDHTGANVQIREYSGAAIGIHSQDAHFLERGDLCGAFAFGFPFTPHKPDFTFIDNLVLECGGMKIRFIHTPGHTPGGSCIFLEETGRETVLFSGDTLFCGSVGRTDLPGGDFTLLQKSLEKLKKIIPPETIIIPGHGEQTSMKEELETNPFLTVSSEQ
jgi:glyoxylase-like metal-dependent hydrolase (beta-lactamase superfamily II)